MKTNDWDDTSGFAEENVSRETFCDASGKVESGEQVGAGVVELAAMALAVVAVAAAVVAGGVDVSVDAGVDADEGEGEGEGEGTVLFG